MKTKNEIILSQLPDDVFELLWLLDGPYKNIQQIKKEGAYIYNIPYRVDTLKKKVLPIGYFCML